MCLKRGHPLNPARYVCHFANVHGLLTELCIESDSCRAIISTMTAMSIVAAATKSFLFLRRVRAVYAKSIHVTLCFFVGWLAVVGTRAAIPFATSVNQCIFVTRVVHVC